MNPTRASRCDQIIALIDACLADIEPPLGHRPTIAVAHHPHEPPRAPRAALNQLAPAERTTAMHSALTEMLATAHRDQLLGEAAEHRLARRARRHPAPGQPRDVS